MLLENIKCYKKTNRYRCIINAKKSSDLNLWQSIAIFWNPMKMVDIPTLDLDITTFCNLRCEACGKNIPYYKKHEHYSSKMVLHDLKHLLSYINKIYSLSIIGGEPFLNNDIEAVIEFCDQSQQLGYIDIVTNGTVIPKDSVLKRLKGSRVHINISEYQLNAQQQVQRERLIQILQNTDIDYSFKPQEYWKNLGILKNYNYNFNFLRWMYNACPMRNCVVLHNGKLYHCGRSCFCYLEKNIRYEDEILDVRTIYNKNDMKRAIKKFYSIPYLKYCNYCAASFERIPAAVQIH